jgi:hypothetical protein
MPEKIEGIMITPKIKRSDKYNKNRDMDSANKEPEGEGQEQPVEQENPFTEYNNKAIQSFLKKGFGEQITHGFEAPDTRIKDFISRVDLTKDHQRKIMTMTKDYVGDSRKKIPKEFLVYQEEWICKNWLGETLRCSDNIEGVYWEVDTEPEVKWNDRNGRSEVVGQKLAGSHPIHYIPFSKEKVDEIIAKSDSDKDEIIYVVKSPPRRDHFNYDEFTNYSWEQLESILLYDGGVVAVRADRALQNSGKVLTANNLGFKPS